MDKSLMTRFYGSRGRHAYPIMTKPAHEEDRRANKLLQRLYPLNPIMHVQQAYINKYTIQILYTTAVSNFAILTSKHINQSSLIQAAWPYEEKAHTYKKQ